MKPQFRLTRFLRVLNWLYTYEHQKVQNLFLFAVPIFTWYQTYVLYTWPQDGYFRGVTLPEGTQYMLNEIANVCLLFLAAMMSIGATFAFSTLHRRHAGRQLLLLPASNLEKFLALWLIYVPLPLVVLIAAFCVSDLLRMLLLPLLTEQGHWPSAIPAFFYWLWQWLSGQIYIVQVWALIFVIHTFCLLCSVVAGYVGWLLSALTVFGCAYSFLEYYGRYDWQVALLLLLAAVFLLLAYRLFCRFPLFKSLYFIRFHGI